MTVRFRFELIFRLADGKSRLALPCPLHKLITGLAKPYHSIVQPADKTDTGSRLNLYFSLNNMTTLKKRPGYFLDSFYSYIL